MQKGAKHTMADEFTISNTKQINSKIEETLRKSESNVKATFQNFSRHCRNFMSLAFKITFHFFHISNAKSFAKMSRNKLDF